MCFAVHYVAAFCSKFVMVFFCNKFKLSADLTVTESYNGFGNLPYVIVINALLNSTCILSCLILALAYPHAFSKK